MYFDRDLLIDWIWFYSYTNMKTVAGELEEQYSFNGDNEYSSQSDFFVAGDDGG